MKMTDLEKAVKGLECCQYSSKSHCDECPYIYESLCSTNDCTADLASDALELLKEQEPKLVISGRQCEVAPGHWERKGFCPKCHQEVLWMVNREYCGFCGQKVEWE